MVPVRVLKAAKLGVMGLGAASLQRLLSEFTRSTVNELFESQLATRELVSATHFGHTQRVVGGAAKLTFAQYLLP
jgi:hypothetical protein